MVYHSRRLTFAVLLALLITLGSLGCREWQNNGGSSSASRPQLTTPVLERVLKTSTIRASYAVAAPLRMKDPNTGQLSGVGVDILNEVGRRLGLKVAWVEETGWGALFEGLNSDRYDIFGAGVWRNGSRGRAAFFTEPILYNVIKVWGHPGEKRFPSLQSINAANVRIATQDGGMDSLIATSDFPRASQISVPQISNYSEVLLNVTTGKADITLGDPTLVGAFLATNPGTLVELFPNQPLRVFPVCFPIKMGAADFKSMIDSALIEMQGDGAIDKILTKYEKHSGDFYRVQVPYQAPSGATGERQIQPRGR
jgi:ABC-type amino acid transport substrate-binding protein